MRMLPHVASRVLGTPLLIGQAKLEAILAVLGPRIGIEPPSFALRATEGEPDSVPDRTLWRTVI